RLRRRARARVVDHAGPGRRRSDDGRDAARQHRGCGDAHGTGGRMSDRMPGASLARTPLSEQHRALGAKLVEFGGWEMPVSYRGILEEHRAVRTAAGLFDVSHMGEIEVLGPHAAATCQRLTTNDVRRLANGHVQYTLLCREDGGVVDDVTLYRIDDQRFFFSVNASNV